MKLFQWFVLAFLLSFNTLTNSIYADDGSDGEQSESEDTGDEEENKEHEEEEESSGE